MRHVEQAVVLLVLVGCVCLLGDLYLRLLSRWCPPDPRQRRWRPPDLTEYRLARLRRGTVERYHERHPFDQEIE